MTEPQATEAGPPSPNGDTGPTQVPVKRPDRTPLTQRDPAQLASVFFQSGYFTDVASQAQAIVKCVAGEELGIGPMASMQGVHIIEGKPSLSANLLGVLVKRSERYNFRPLEVTAEKAQIEFYEDGEAIGVSEFTIEQADRAGIVKAKSGWEKYPEAMLFARALSQGVRWYCPDVTAGSPAYVPEELGADVDDAGEPIYVETESEVVPPAPQLDAERVEHLAKGIEVAGPELGGVNPIDGLNVLLGSIGIDGFDPVRPIDEQLAALRPEQADALDVELQRVLDAQAEGESADADENGGEG